MNDTTATTKFEQLQQSLTRTWLGYHVWTKTLIIGGLSVTVHSIHEQLLRTFLRPFQHLVQTDEDLDQDTQLTDGIRLDLGLRQDFTRQAIAPWPWERPLYVDDATHVEFDVHHNLIRGHNYVERHFIYVFDALDESLWTRPEYSRPSMELIFSRLQLTSVHGGTLGRAGRGVLITAKGGSGKSSLVTAGVSKGLQTVGDDFQLLAFPPSDNGSHRLWSLYHSVKLAADSPAWPHINSDAKAEPPLPGAEKSAIDLLDRYRSGVVAFHDLTAIVVPNFGERAHLQPLSKALALKALLPTSIGMSTRKRESAAALTRLVADLPCFSLTITRDLDAAVTEIDRLLCR